ncbi:MAG TPA: glycosyltransferase family 4 protein [Terriglobales bacterium]|nr:glycosyltransferase family 4 protein [Terriglobales bacterium]
MRVALIVPPFISVPPQRYGGTELFASHLAEGLANAGVDVVLYTNGESTLPVERKWLYPRGQWPLEGEIFENLTDINHAAWAVRDAAESCDLIHVSNAPALVHSRFLDTPFVYTIHHPHQKGLSDFYTHYPDIHYVAISDFQRKQERMPKLRTIHHGIDMTLYEAPREKRTHLSFLGRIAPVKGTHVAIQVAKKAGIPLKIAGEIQPMFQEYYETLVKPHVDGKFIEYVGEADLAAKNELLGKSLGFLFPIQWDEPFGLVMIEAMACGAPVLAFPHGSVPEVVKDGVSGYVCNSVEQMAMRARLCDKFNPAEVRSYVVLNFSVDKMVKQYINLYSEILETTLATTDTLATGEATAAA